MTPIRKACQSSIHFIKDCCMGKKGAETLFNTWVNEAINKQGLHLQQIVGVHGTRINKGGRFPIQSGETTTLTATSDLYLAPRVEIAASYALGLGHSSTGVREDDSGVDGDPGLVLILEAELDKMLERFGCPVIPAGSNFTCTALPICKEVSRRFTVAHVAPKRIVGVAGLIALVVALTLNAPVQKKTDDMQQPLTSYVSEVSEQQEEQI